MARGYRIALGPAIAAAGAAVLIVSLFLDWYGDLSAFTAFEVLDLVLLGLGVAGIVAAARELEVPLPGARQLGTGAVLPLGLAALVIVLSQLLNHPPAGVGRDPKVGLWLGLGGTGLWLLGGIMATARVSVAVDPRPVPRGRVGRDGRSAVDPDAPTEPHPPGEPPA